MTRIIDDKEYGKAYGVELKCLRDLEKDFKKKKAEQPKRQFRKYTKTIRLVGGKDEI